MSLVNAKHIVGEIDGIRCTIIEKGVGIERAAFLRDLLEFNNLEVKEMQDETDNPEAEPTYTIGVTNLVFNPVFAIYECQLKTPAGDYVTPGYWEQECVSCDTRYWIRGKRKVQDFEDN